MTMSIGNLPCRADFAPLSLASSHFEKIYVAGVVRVGPDMVILGGIAFPSLGAASSSPEWAMYRAASAFMGYYSTSRSQSRYPPRGDIRGQPRLPLRRAMWRN